MFCKKCGNPLENGLVCTSCGYRNELEAGLILPKEVSKTVCSEEVGAPFEHRNEWKKNGSFNRNKLWAWMSGIMFVISLIPLYKGYDKMVNYYSSDTYYSLNKNAYVGGDAYNYIINAGYATAFFVLAIGAAILGVGFLIVYYLSEEKGK